MATDFQFIPHTNVEDIDRTWIDLDQHREACLLCGYVESATGATLEDNRHDNLCCGGTVVCHDFVSTGRPCESHLEEFRTMTIEGITPKLRFD